MRNGVYNEYYEYRNRQPNDEIKPIKQVWKEVYSIMNYRHIYHAGNFADVFKHCILIALIQTLLRKEKPFCYLDTHAGIGRYDLHAVQAQKTHEHDLGITRLLQHHNKTNFPQEIQTYLKIIYSLNTPSTTSKKPLLRIYPGSPLIVRGLLRPDDHMILTELHKEDIRILKQEFQEDMQVDVHQQDGYQALKAFLPPQIRRGLVLIDPSYEQTNELEQIITALQTALQRWATGIYAVWYPIKDKRLNKRLHRNLQSSGIQKILLAEMNIYPDDSPLSLNGCGMAIINPPWQFDNQLASLVSWLWQILSVKHAGRYQVQWLVE